MTRSSDGISQRSQSESQRLIEDFMIAANVAAAQTLIGASRPCVFRVHDQPDPEKTEGVRDLASAVGTKPKGQVLRPQHFNAVLAHVRDTADEKMVNEAVLRVRQKLFIALKILDTLVFRFEITHISHRQSEGMPTCWCIVHWLTLWLAASRQGGLGSTQPADLADICQHISETEARLQELSAEPWTVCRHFCRANRQGCQRRYCSRDGFRGFCQPSGWCGGRLHAVAYSTDDYYVLDQNGMRMHGRHNGVSFGVGDKVDVLVVDVTPVNGGILLSYVDGGVKGRKMSGRTGGGRKPRGKPRGSPVALNPADRKAVSQSQLQDVATVICADKFRRLHFAASFEIHTGVVSPVRRGASKMAKPATLQIKLVSTADTGYFYVTKRIRVQSQRSLKFANTTRRRASTCSSVKRKLSNHWAGFDLDRPYL